jgi:hypothetical protein
MYLHLMKHREYTVAGNGWLSTEGRSVLHRNPKPLIQIQPKMLIDQKNRKAFATGGDILLADGQTIPLPGGFALPTTGLWSQLLDIPVVRAWLLACNHGGSLWGTMRIA